jgi:hypothetical protein
LSYSVSIFSQNLLVSLGQTQTSTSFRTSDLREGGNHLLFTPKRGWAGEVGVEYAIKPKSSFYSSFAFYQSGATQEDYRVIGQDPLFFFNLEDNEYSYNCWSLNTNYNMEIWRAGKVKLMAIAGLHIDRLIFNGDDSYGWVNDNDDRSPLRILSRNEALRKTNVGCNLGGKAVYTANRWSYSLNYAYAPRLFKMGKYEKKQTDPDLSRFNAYSVREKVSFLTLGVGFNLKGNK